MAWCRRLCHTCFLHDYIIDVWFLGYLWSSIQRLLYYNSSTPHYVLKVPLVFFYLSVCRRSMWRHILLTCMITVYPKKYEHGFVVLCFVVVMQSFIMNSHEVFIHIHQGCFAGTGAVVRLPQCQWSKPDGYGKISQCITTTKHSKAKTVCIFLGIYCMSVCLPFKFRLCIQNQGPL